MSKTMKYAFIGLLLVGLAAIVYALSGAMGTKTYQNQFERYAVGEMQRLDFKTSGDPAPLASFIGADGQSATLADFQGRIVLVNFWATWCGPCEKEMPSLGALQRARGGVNFTILAISVDAEEDADYARRRLDELAGPGTLDFYIATPESSYEVVYGAGVRGFPTSILYAADGKEIARIAREADWSSLDAVNFIDAVLKEN